MEVPFSPVISPDVLLDMGLSHHREGEYDKAKEFRLAAFGRAETPGDQSRAARDIAYSFLRLYDTDRKVNKAIANDDLAQAQNWAEKAVSIPELEDGREKYASFAARAIVLAREAAYIPDRSRGRRMGKRATRQLSEANDNFNSEQALKPDQYQVNIMGRLALLEAGYGGPARSLRVGLRAAGLALKSESPRWVENADPSLTTKERLKAKAKAGIRAAVVPLVLVARGTGADYDSARIVDRLM